MKNMRRSLVTLFALISTSSMAGLVQPTVNVSEDAPFRISAGVKGGMTGGLKDSKSKEEVYGFGNLGGGLGFVHNVGSDFEYGLSLSFERATISPASIFTEDENFKKGVGFRMDAALMGRYMPELAEGFRFGGFLELGARRHLTAADKTTLEAHHKKVGMVDLSVKLGPALNYSFTDSVAIYTAPTFAISNIRFGGDMKEEDKKKENNLMGAALPLGLWFAATDSFGIFVEAEPRITNFAMKDPKDDKKNAFMKSFEGEATLGVTFSI